MSIISNEINIVLSSSPDNGAKNLNPPFNNQFDVTLQNQISIPKDAINPRIALVSANVWNSCANISPSFQNNRLRLIIEGNIINVIFEAGLYSLSAINTVIGNALFGNTPSYSRNRIQIDPDYSTSRCAIFWNGAVGDVVDFTVADSIGPLLGWRTTDIITATQVGTYSYSPNRATLNRVNSFLIGCSVVGSSGIPLNDLSTGVVAQIPIIVSPGSLITYQPQHLSYVGIGYLKGNSISNVAITLYDQNRRFVDTSSETFDIMLKIMWESKI